MSRSAKNRDWWLSLAVACVLSVGYAAGNPLCSESPAPNPTGLCELDPALFLNPRLQPSGSADFPTRHGVPLSISQADSETEASPARRGFWRILGLYAILLLLAAACAGAAILAIRPYLRGLKEPGCPNCGSPEIRISFPEGPLDWSFGLFSCSPYRCKVCYYRFHKMPLTEGQDLVSQDTHSA